MILNLSFVPDRLLHVSLDFPGLRYFQNGETNFLKQKIEIKTAKSKQQNGISFQFIGQTGQTVKIEICQSSKTKAKRSKRKRSKQQSGKAAKRKTAKRQHVKRKMQNGETCSFDHLSSRP